MRINWKNKTACIIAGGPSLKQWQIDHAVKSKIKIIAVNNSYQLCPVADVLYACDSKWWQHYRAALDFKGYKFSLEDSGFPDVFQLKNSGNSGIDFDWPNIRTGRNSGYQAINLAVLFGCRRIILIGYDMQHTGGKRHWHPDHPQGLNNPYQVKNWIKYFDDAASILKENGIEVINCTIETALTCFKKMDIRDAI